MLSVVIPAFDEERRLPSTLERVRAWLDAQDEPYEVVVVDDGSRDGTVAAAQRAATGWSHLRVLQLDRNRGKGAAVRAGMLATAGEHRLFSDADLSTPIEELPRLRAELRGNCQIAIASRAVPGTRIEVHQPRRREFMGRTYNRLLRGLVLPGIRDSQCGFKVFTAEAAVACFGPLQTLGFGFDAEVLMRARHHGWHIAEVPVRWSHADSSSVHSFRDPAHMLVDLVRLRVRGSRH